MVPPRGSNATFMLRYSGRIPSHMFARIVGNSGHVLPWKEKTNNGRFKLYRAVSISKKQPESQAH